MTDIKLRPLPEADDSVENRAQWPFVTYSDVWLQESVQDYARANMEPLLAEIEALRASKGATYIKYELLHAELAKSKAQAERLAEALRLIAAPMRPDGTWNRDREACRQIACDALTDHDQEVGNE
nr:MAG TPA_asm: hypothetical protein [Caudoviricetes sp.]